MPLGPVDVVAPLGVAAVAIGAFSLLPEPTRQRYMAIVVAGAGAAYLGAGLGPWELVFTALATTVAFRGLDSYRAIGAAWLMHVAWDVVHHVWAEPILPFLPTSSAQCAVCDTVLAAWFFAGAPTLPRR